MKKMPKPLSHQMHATSRAGTTLTELLVSCFLLGTLVVFVAPMTMRVARQRMVHREIQVARHELMNQMERLTLLSHDDLQELATEPVEVSAAHADVLADADLQLQFEPEGDAKDDKGAEDGKGAKPAKLRLSLQWTNRLGNRAAPQTLTAWSRPINRDGGNSQ